MIIEFIRVIILMISFVAIISGFIIVIFSIQGYFEWCPMLIRLNILSGCCVGILFITIGFIVFRKLNLFINKE